MIPRMQKGIGEKEHVMIHAEEAAKMLEEKRAEPFDRNKYSEQIKREMDAYDVEVRSTIEKLESSVMRFPRLEGINPRHIGYFMRTVGEELKELGYRVKVDSLAIKISW